MTKDKQFVKDVYGYTFDLLENVDPESLCMILARWMSREDLKGCLDANELSPRFIEEDEDDGDI